MKGAMRFGVRLFFLTSVTGVLACTDTVAPTAPTPVRSSLSAAAPGLEAERANLTELTRALATALGDPEVRQLVKGDMRGSRATFEHKLHFATYLHGPSGGRLAAKLATVMGKRPDDVLAMLGSVRPLEFYMPVRAHRAAWTGGDDLIIASQLVEGQDPVGFRTDGSPVTLSRAAAPTTPVLAIVPAETDFSRPLASEWQQGEDQGGAAIGTLRLSRGQAAASHSLRPDLAPQGALGGSVDPGDVRTTNTCDDRMDYCEPDPTSPPPAVYPAGVYLDYSSLSDLGEDWIRGHPEIELFVIGPTFDPSSQGEKISCAGWNGAGVKNFHQDTPQWRAAWWQVEGQIMSIDDVQRYQQIYNAPYSIQLWEDDDQACEIISSGRSQLEQLYDNLRAAQRATTLFVQIFFTPIDQQPDLRVAAGRGNALRAAIAGIFQSDDDFLGNAVYTPGSEQGNYTGDTYRDADMVLMNGASNGRVTIRTVNQAH